MNAHDAHVRLTPEQVKDRWLSGHLTAQGYLSLLLDSLKRPGWEHRIDDISEFCQEWQLSRSTFYRAKAQLVAKGWMKEEILGSVVLVSNQRHLSQIVDSQSQIVDSQSQIVDSQSQIVDSQSQIVENESPKGTKFKAFSDSPDLFRSNSDLFRSSSSGMHDDAAVSHESDIKTEAIAQVQFIPVNGSEIVENVSRSETQSTPLRAIVVDPRLGFAPRMRSAFAPRWDDAAPWGSDEERKEFQSYLEKKYASKQDPESYACKIVCSVGKGVPSVDWDRFKTMPRAKVEAMGHEAEILKEWGSRKDWQRFPLLQEWKQAYAEMGSKFFDDYRCPAKSAFARWVDEGWEDFAHAV